jgi:hypothetical protein
MTEKVANTTKATTAGAAGATGGGIVLAWIAGIASGKWGVPLELAATIIAPIFGFFSALAMRWAAKLNPKE